MYEAVPSGGTTTIIIPSRRNKLAMCGEDDDEDSYEEHTSSYSLPSPNKDSSRRHRLAGASTSTLVHVSDERDRTRYHNNNEASEGIVEQQLVTNENVNNNNYISNNDRQLTSSKPNNINERVSNINLKSVMDPRSQSPIDLQQSSIIEDSNNLNKENQRNQRNRNGIVQRNGGPNKDENCFVGIGDRVDVEHIKLENYKILKTQHVAVQTTHLSPYRLRFWPVAASIKCVDASFKDVLKCCLRTLSQWFLSQVGLTCVLLIWALLGATAFYKTEGPRENEQAEQINHHKIDIAIDLATDLRQLKEGSDKWPETIQKYLNKHESLLLQAVSSGYVEGGGSIWTYPGCVLFAVLLLTTLGFGAPVPRTSLGRGMAVLFSAVGIPLHFMLILNISSLIAKCLQNLATIKPSGDIQEPKTKRRLWYKWFPPILAVLYYVLGVICFGVLRKRSAVECLMFALDFTESGGVANTSGHVRILYALYIEIAVILAATIMSIVQVSATNGIIDLGLRLGLLTNT